MSHTFQNSPFVIEAPIAVFSMSNMSEATQTIADCAQSTRLIEDYSTIYIVFKSIRNSTLHLS